MADRWIFYGISLLSAASWALGSILWRKLGDEISPVTMNLSKGLIGSLLMGLCLLGMQSVPLAPRPLMFLAASGVIGISVGDTFFFKALMQLGPRLTSLFGTLYPVSIALAATVFLGERLSTTGWLGIFLTTSGVGWVLWERAPAADRHKGKPLGIWYASLAIASTTVAVLLAKIGVEAVPAMEASVVRLLSGT
ncbi:MAG: DMT family transporter, partial [Proteobacteria bacterium]|nr:DMT family transporter [Pseudomonadota bacterium]